MTKKNSRNPLSRMFSGRASGDASSNGATVDALREEVRRLQQSVETLSILNDLAVAMGTSANPEEAVEKLVDRSLRAVDAEQAVVTLLGQDEGAPFETQVRVVRSSAEHQSFHVNESLVGWMLLNKKPLLISNPKNDERFRGLSWDETISSVMCIPLMLKSELIGVLSIYNRKGLSAFTEEDERLMSIIGATAAPIIENAALAKDKNRMEEQLNLAIEIQRNLLPTSPPILAGYDIAGASIPAQSVGGDYFDYITIDDSNLALCLGDVSGKGFPAALLMANVQATLRGQTLVAASANERIGRANKLLYECTDDERFVTLFYGVLDSSTHEVVYCSAGHDPPFLFSSDGTHKRLEQRGLALGVVGDFEYQQASVPLKLGDVLVIYSDGITDAENKSEDQFGAERLAALIGEYVSGSAHDLVETIMDGVNEHAGGAPQFDDLTVLVVRRTK